MSNIPSDYKPTPDALNPPTFQAPAHHLTSAQAEEVVRLAESSHGQTGSSTGFTGSNSGYSSSTGVGSGLTGSTGTAGYGSSADQYGSSNTRGGDVLGGGTGSVTQTHTGQPGNYELGQRELTDNRTSLTGGSSGLGAGAGVGAGAGAAGLGAAGLAGSQHNKQEALSGDGIDSSGNRRHDGSLDPTANSGSGPTASHGTLEHSLQSELERNARKSGTHAAGFGTAGMSSDTGILHHESTGVSKTGATGGYSQGGSSGLTSSSGLTGGAAAGTGLSQGGLTGQTGNYGTTSSTTGGLTGGNTGRQGLEDKLIGEVEGRAHGAGSSNVTGLGSSAAQSQSHSGGQLGSSTGRAL